VTGSALETVFPALRDSLRRIALTELPTPVAPAAALAAETGLESLHIKRDDQTAPVYGGNKVRKLEYLFGDAIHRGCDAVVTFGAVGSNHALATAIYADRLGLGCHVIMTDQPVTPYIARTLRYHALLGTHLEYADSHGRAPAIADRLASRHPTGAGRLYRIPGGGSSPLGALGYVNAALELAAQCTDTAPDVIYVPCGTMGTVAGLALGLRLAGMQTRIEAVRVVPEQVATSSGIEALCRAANLRLHEIDATIPLIGDPLNTVRLREEFFGTGYAETTPGCRQAVALIRSTESLVLETTYTGKALAALVHDARDGRLNGRRVMFWNTYNARPYPAAVDDEDGSTLPQWARRYLREPQVM